MKIKKEDLAKWETDEPELMVEPLFLKKRISDLEKALLISLPDEYLDYIHLVADQACSPLDELDNFIAIYNGITRVAVMATLSSTDRVVSSTKLLQESVYDHRSLLPNGLIAIGSEYDDDGDAYIIYDVRPESPTYRNIFHWRYYVDSLIVGDGLGLLALSLRDFLHKPALESEL
ncbi:SMI1/KNR4 family protein [Comamonas testosteroni]|uniref:SMI1/KNR4 family protein n=1 Tax=Comamonas testosteroni TaxID=285 RepID=UPI0023AA8A71|nr:SMI1/KNR4 family protein [Comamonas testosteroni]WEE79496.1 SMI1/KNR4 family protein [Comamonas testosteroni]